MPDGTSNTVMFAERFRNCSPDGAHGGGCTLPAWAWNTLANSGDCWSSPTFGAQQWDPFGQKNGGNMNCGGALLFYPVDPNLPPLTPPAGAIGFQAGPSVQACNWYVTQGGHTAGMTVGMGDGSVRQVTNGITAQTWTWACAPSDGNPLPSDWNN
jgi:hypothetical protein